MYGLLLAALMALNVESTIDSVVVYPDQAMVVRTARCRIPKRRTEKNTMKENP